jgi:hypothetical protein
VCDDWYETSTCQVPAERSFAGTASSPHEVELASANARPSTFTVAVADVTVSVQLPPSSMTGTKELTSMARVPEFHSAEVTVTATCVRVSFAGGVVNGAELGSGDAVGTVTGGAGGDTSAAD